MTELTRRALPKSIQNKMKMWRMGATGMPQEYVDFHFQLAIETLTKMANDRITIHSQKLVSDGWGDGMRVVEAVVEKNEELAKIQWNDTNQGFMQRSSAGGWMSPRAVWLRPYFSRSSK